MSATKTFTTEQLKNFAQYVRIQRDSLAPIKMTTGGERTHPIVIDEGVVKEWIGFAWIELHEADQSDLDQYPSVVD